MLQNWVVWGYTTISKKIGAVNQTNLHRPSSWYGQSACCVVSDEITAILIFGGNFVAMEKIIFFSLIVKIICSARYKKTKKLDIFRASSVSESWAIKLVPRLFVVRNFWRDYFFPNFFIIFYFCCGLSFHKMIHSTYYLHSTNTEENTLTHTPHG